MDSAITVSSSGDGVISLTNLKMTSFATETFDFGFFVDAETVSSGLEYSEVLFSEEITFLVGDVDMNGKINSRDVMLLKKAIVGENYGIDIRTCDFDRDGTLSGRDILHNRRIGRADRNIRCRNRLVGRTDRSSCCRSSRYSGCSRIVRRIGGKLFAGLHRRLSRIHDNHRPRLIRADLCRNGNAGRHQHERDQHNAGCLNSRSHPEAAARAGIAGSAA